MKRTGVAFVLLFAGTAESAAEDPLPVDVCAPVSAEERQAAGAVLEAAQPLIVASDWPRAEPRLLEALRFDPGHGPALYTLGQSLLGQGRPREAFELSREAYRCVLEGDPEVRMRLERERTAQLFELRATLREVEREHGAGRMVANQEVNAHQAMPSRGNLMRTIREIEEKIRELEFAPHLADPAPPEVTYALGTALVQSGQIERAAVELRAAVAREPESGDAHTNLAVALLLLGELDAAEQAARRAEKLGVPVNPRIYEEIEKRR